MLELLIKIFLTPENIFGLIFNILGIISFCFIFREWEEKWWKSLVPIYNTYIIYKYLWKRKWFCLLQFLFSIINIRCIVILKKEILVESINSILNYIKNDIFNINFNFNLLFICIIFFTLSYIVIFTMKRISYFKLCKQYKSPLFLKIGTFIFPDIFLIISYIFYKKKGVSYVRNNIS